MTPYLKDEFLSRASIFLDELRGSNSFDDIQRLWRSVNIPYRPESCDPFSAMYRDEILDIYRRLTHVEYAIANEITSARQSPEDFDIGYPWISGNLAVVADEMAKPLQVCRALHDAGKTGSKIIEFGAGWGNLALPLARARQNITVVDIDEGFIKRIERKAEAEELQISAIMGDFIDVARTITEKFDVTIFQSSFHHCLDFVELLKQIRRNVLKENGIIFFVSEPIIRDLGFPWGLRYDGESLWAIMCNTWLELGFDFNFFSLLLARTGFFLTPIASISGFIGEGWLACRGENGIDLSQWALPDEFDQTFHASDGYEGRFCKSVSVLPPLTDGELKTYELSFTNYGLERLEFTINGEMRSKISLEPNGALTMRISAAHETVRIYSDTFVPDRQSKNGDLRLIGVRLCRIRLVE